MRATTWRVLRLLNRKWKEHIMSQRFAHLARVREWMKENTVQLRGEVTNGALELAILGPIGESMWDGDGITAKAVEKTLSAYGGGEIVVLLDSPGGSVFDGVAIKNLLQRHPANVTVEVIGEATSAGSIIAMGGNTIKMHVSAMMMIHRPTLLMGGYAEDFRRAAEMLDKIQDSIVDAYAERTSKLTRDQLVEMVNAETWLSADDAVSAGLADEIMRGKAPKETKSKEAKDSAKAERRYPFTSQLLAEASRLQ